MAEDGDARRSRLSAAQAELMARRLRGAAPRVGPAIPRCARGAALALAPAQERLWFLDRLGLGTAYNMGHAVRLRGVLDLERLQASLDAVVARHEILRTTYADVEGEPRQEVHDSGRVLLERLPDATAVGAAWEAQTRRPFELARELPLRAALMRLGPNEHVLFLTLHHIAGDDWSQGTLQRELFLHYRGEAGELAPLSIQYADYAAWQRARSDAALEGQLAYWREQLADVSALELPFDRPRPSVQAMVGGSVDFTVSIEDSRRLEAIAREAGVTTATLLLAAYALLLGRFAGQEDVAVGSPVTHRPLPELEPLIGLFVSTVVMRTDLSGDPTFHELLVRVHQVALGAQANLDVPFEKLVEVLRPERDLTRNPLFQVLFAVMAAPGGSAPSPQPLPGKPGTGDELEVLPCAVDAAVTRFDLELNVRVAGQVAGRFCFDRDLFDAETIERLAQSFVTLLTSISAEPRARLSELKLLTGEQRLDVLSRWNATAQDFSDSELLPQRFAACVRNTPDTPALISNGRTWTYAELGARVNQLTGVLRRRGVCPGSCVAVSLERGPALVVTILAVAAAGGAWLPVATSDPKERVALLLRDAGAELLVTNAEVAARASAEQAPTLVLDDGLTLLEGESADAFPCPAAALDLAYVIYTSGSTGRPKGVMTSHAAIANRISWMQATFALTGSDRVLQKTPFTFDVSVWEFLWPLTTGACLVLAEPGGHGDPAYLLELIERERVSTVHFVPSMLRAFLELPDLAPARSLTRVIASGEALPSDLRDAFLERTDAQLFNLYGPTEAAIDVTWDRCGRADRGASAPIGRPVANTTTYVLDPALEPVPVGAAGELYLGGVQLARGYLNRADLTAERFLPDPFGAPGARLYRTGDRARYLADGRLEFLGRTDQQVKIRGHRVEPGEVEAALLECVDVRAAAVLAWHEPGRAASSEARLVAYFVPAPGSDVTRDQLRDHLRVRLPAYLQPDLFVSIDALPLTSSGKLDRAALPSPAEAREEGAEFTPPSSPLEEELAAIWAELLPADRIGTTDSFFELGGHSLLATRLVARVRTHLGVELPLRAVFDRPTIAELSLEVLRLMLAQEELEA